MCYKGRSPEPSNESLEKRSGPAVLDRWTDTYVPTDHDVICGRSKQYYRHVGNRRFRELIASKIRPYLLAQNKVDKGMVIFSIMKAIQNDGGHFIRPDLRSSSPGTWQVVDDATAREKIGANIRAIVKSMGGEDVLLSKLNDIPCQSNIQSQKQASSNVEETFSQDAQAVASSQSISPTDLVASNGEVIYSSSGLEEVISLLMAEDSSDSSFIHDIADATIVPAQNKSSLQPEDHYWHNEKALYNWIPATVLPVDPTTKRNTSVSSTCGGADGDAINCDYEVATDDMISQYDDVSTSSVWTRILNENYYSTDMTDSINDLHFFDWLPSSVTVRNEEVVEGGRNMFIPNQFVWMYDEHSIELKADETDRLLLDIQL